MLRRSNLSFKRLTVRDGIKLAHFPNMALTVPPSPVTQSDWNKPSFPLQIQRLNDAAHKLQCLSFSAPKIKWDAQVILLKATPDVDDYEVFINPEVPGYDDRTAVVPMYGMWENCVCCSSLHAWVMRPQKINVKAQDEYGETREAILEGVRARLLMHELDHLRGTSFLQQAPSTDFIVSSAALAQQELWPENWPSMEARMTGMNQAFDYVTNQVIVPPGLEWASAIAQAFSQFQNNRIRAQ